MKFADIPAHFDVKDKLRALVNDNRIPHALLLEGPSGVGKMMMARAFAQYIHCTNHTPDGDSCGKCSACLQHQAFNHIDTHFSFPAIKRKNSSSPFISDDYIEVWRKFLVESPYMDFALWQDMLGNSNAQPYMSVEESQSLIKKLKYTSTTSRYMIVIMWLPEKMNEPCANKLLKLIEEPHDDTIFILVSDESSHILPTIYSRLQRVEMKRLSDESIASALIHDFSVDESAANDIARLSDGSMITARNKIDSQADDRLYFNMYVRVMRSAYQRKIIDLKDWANEFADLGREKSMRFLDYCERVTGENYIYNLQHPELVYLDSQEEQFSRNFARFIDYENVEKLRKLFIDARRDIAGNANAKIVMFDVAVRIILLLKKK